MLVAVRLVEVLVLLTILSILTGFSIFVVAAQRVIFILMLLVTPLTYIMYGVLYASEKVMISILAALLHLTDSIGEF